MLYELFLVWTLLLCIWKTDGFAWLYVCASLNLVTCVFIKLPSARSLCYHAHAFGPSYSKILDPPLIFVIQREINIKLALISNNTSIVSLIFCCCYNVLLKNNYYIIIIIIITIILST